MSARLVLLGRLSDLIPGGECEVDPAPLDQILVGLDPALALALSDERVRFALNGQLVSRDHRIVLGKGDELAFLPPVSGG